MSDWMQRAADELEKLRAELASERKAKEGWQNAAALADARRLAAEKRAPEAEAKIREFRLIANNATSGAEMRAKQLEAATAESAALREALEVLRDGLDAADENPYVRGEEEAQDVIGAALRRPGPGAEMLERLRKAEAPRLLDLDAQPEGAWKNVLLERDSLQERCKRLEAAGRCETCGSQATCVGQYEDAPTGFGCDVCCGHGNEDGRCTPVGARP